jgi:sulfate/thiosulfate transport system ATP-binding protein
MTNAIIVRGANKHYGDFAALDNVDFEVPSGSLTALLGPSGSGKSTLLRAIAGLDLPDTGTVTINGRDVTHIPPQRRGIGFVFQHYAAFKHMNVQENVAFGLRVRKRPKQEIRRRVAELLELVHLEQMADRYPAQLSGGQLQRVAIALALALRAEVLLADEPTSALDVTVQAEVLELLRELRDSRGMAVLFVSHDLAVIAELCDRVAIMRAGQVVEQGPVGQVIAAPRHDYTRELLAAVPRLTEPGPGE